MAAITYSEDMSTDILLRLPARSIIKLRFLSKLWHSIVSTPRFRQTHASRHTKATSSGLFFVGEDNHHYGRLGYLPMHQNNPKVSFHDIRVDTEDGSFTCTSSCNGLFLLRSLTSESGDDVKIHTYYVYNPTTKEYKILDIPTRIRRNLLVTASLAYDPSESPHYKVVFCWIQDMEVYSSMTKTLKSKSFNEDLCFGGNGVFCNGSIHWLTYEPTRLNSFDVDSEREKFLLAPGLCLARYNVVEYFGQSRGHLYLGQSEDNCKVLKFYELKKDYSDWCLKFQVDQKYVNIYRALSIFINEEEDLTMVVLEGDEWVEYNLGKKKKKTTTKKLSKLPISYYNSRFPFSSRFSTHQFIPTLTSL